MGQREPGPFATHFESDARRTQRLAALGWTVFPVTWLQLRSDKQGFLLRVRRAISVRRAIAAPWLSALDADP